MNLLQIYTIVIVAVLLIMGILYLLTHESLEDKEKREHREWQEYKNKHQCKLLLVDETSGKCKWQRSDGVIIINYRKN